MHFKRRLSPSVKADMVPMIDVVFQLVIFFMVSSTFLQTPGIPLKLPQSSTAEAVEMTRLVVTVITEDEIYLNKEKYNLEEFSTALSEYSDDDREKITAVVIEGDEKASYEVLVKVLDLLRVNKFEGVNLRMRKSTE